MKDFNLYDEFLENKGLKLKNNQKLYVLGKTGDLNNYRWKDWRTKEKDLSKTRASVLVGEKGQTYLEWKMVYKNSKGYYVKFGHKNCYIDIP